MEWYTFTFGPGENVKRHRVRRRLPFVGLFLVVLLAVGAFFGGYSLARMDVTVVEGEEVVALTAFRGTVADLLAREGVEVGPWDRVTPAVNTPLHDGMEIVIQRAVPVTVRVDGQRLELWTVAARVDQVLAEAGVELNAGDLIVPEPETPVSKGLEICVVRVVTETEEREFNTPYQVERRPAYDLPKGETRVLVHGQNGLRRETWQVVYHDGEEVARELVRSEEIVRPRNQVVLVGMLDTVSRGGQDIRFYRVITAEATAYTYTGNNTATGMPPGPGTVAVDPTVIPLGTRLYIDGYGCGVAMDVGRKIRGNRVDVFFPTRQEALQWGRRTVNVYLLN